EQPLVPEARAYLRRESAGLVIDRRARPLCGGLTQLPELLVVAKRLELTRGIRRRAPRLVRGLADVVGAIVQPVGWPVMDRDDLGADCHVEVDPTRLEISPALAGHRAAFPLDDLQRPPITENP